MMDAPFLSYDVAQVASFFKALADPTRVKLVVLLRANDSLCVCDLTTHLDQPQSTISRHLSYLKNTDIVTSERRGTWMWYGFNPALPSWCQQIINEIVFDESVLDNSSIG